MDLESNKQWIHIWYSWGDIENPVKVPDGKNAWEYMKELVAEEVFVAQEHWIPGCSVYVDYYGDRVELEYLYDNTRCYYQISDSEDYDPFKDEE